MPIHQLGFPSRHARAAVFVSGTGVNAETILKRHQAASDPGWSPVCIVTDRPDGSRAGALAEQFDLPLASLDIRAFYRDCGLKSPALVSTEAWRVRDRWTDALRAMLAPYDLDFGILAGFLALTNLTADMPCLNVHPGDLTYEREGQRYLVGHHTIPIERAILEGLPSLRSSVIIAQPIAGSDDVDSGPVLGVSPPLSVDLGGYDLAQLAAFANARPAKRPRGGWDDPLAEIADRHLSRLKDAGDLVVFPPTVDAFVAGRYALDCDQLLWDFDGDWRLVRTVVFADDKPPAPVAL